MTPSHPAPRPAVEQPRCALIRHIDARRRLVEDMQFFAVRSFASGETYVSRIPSTPASPLGERGPVAVAPCGDRHPVNVVEG